MVSSGWKLRGRENEIARGGGGLHSARPVPNPVKQVVLRLLPRSAQRRIKKWYYPRLLRGYSEERWPEARIVRKLVAPGDHVVDAGANVGYISLILSRIVGPAGIVHSFEPVPQTFDLLENNLRVLGLANVRARRAAVSDSPGRARMATPDYAGGGENLYESKLVGSTVAGSFEVEVVRLADALGADVARVSFVKVDVEGHELAVLRGAEDLLAARPAWLIEVAGDPDATGSDAAQLFALLAAHGYSPHYFAGGRLIPRSRGDKAVDYFFLTGEHRVKLSGEIAA